MSCNIIFYGDPHGNYTPLIDACRHERPEAVFILGDMTGHPVKPLDRLLAPLQAMSIPVHWIPGNHDSESQEVFDATFGSFPEGNLHGKVVQLACGLRVAGLGGVFRGHIWYPKYGLSTAGNFASPEQMVHHFPDQFKWRGGTELRHRTSIFPNDAHTLSKQDADILISHEAPSSRHSGFMALDELASDMGAKVIFHGHHHETYEDELMNGVRVQGLGEAKVYRLRIP